MCVNKLICKTDIEGELTKDKIYDIQSAIYCNMVKVENDNEHNRFYNIDLFENID